MLVIVVYCVHGFGFNCLVVGLWLLLGVRDCVGLRWVAYCCLLGFDDLNCGCACLCVGGVC